jgi:CheY-like chemotaxis protein
MKRKIILLVDDEPDILVYLDTVLQDHGYDVMISDNADDALDMMKKTKPDLVCMDIMMPKKSGLNAYREYKLDEELKDIPAIFISAFNLARDFDGKEFRQVVKDKRVPEPYAFMEKPIQVDKLLENIESALDQVRT